MARVLVVEDDDPIAEPLLRALRRDGHDAAWAGIGGAALTAAGAESFDLVVLDLGLPDIDGIEVCQRLRTADRDLPILVLTARARSSTRSSGSTPAPTTTSPSRSASASCWRASVPSSAGGARPASPPPTSPSTSPPGGRSEATSSWS